VVVRSLDASLRLRDGLLRDHEHVAFREAARALERVPEQGAQIVARPDLGQALEGQHLQH
jgi:hypothetical protein